MSSTAGHPWARLAQAPPAALRGQVSATISAAAGRSYRRGARRRRRPGSPTRAAGATAGRPPGSRRPSAVRMSAAVPAPAARAWVVPSAAGLIRGPAYLAGQWAAGSAADRAPDPKTLPSATMAARSWPAANRAAHQVAWAPARRAAPVLAVRPTAPAAAGWAPLWWARVPPACGSAGRSGVGGHVSVGHVWVGHVWAGHRLGDGRVCGARVGGGWVYG